MVLGTSYVTRGLQDIPDISPILNQYGYEGRAVTMLVNDGPMTNDRMFFFSDRDLSSPALNGQSEGFTDSDLDEEMSLATRRTNFTQILAKSVFVTDSANNQRAVGGNLLLDQTKLKQVAYLNDLEYVTINQTGASGASVAAQRTHGLFSWALNFGDTGTNTRSWVTTQSGVSADTSHLRDMQLRAHKKGVNISDFIVDDVIKSRISTTASTPAPVQRMQDDMTIRQSIDVFKADVAGSRLHLSHYVQLQGGPTGTVGLFGINSSLGHIILGVANDQIERAWYRPTTMRTSAKVGSFTRKIIEGEVGYRYWTPAAIQVNWNMK